MLTRRLRLMLDGQFDQAGFDRPRMYVGDRVHLARRVLANTGFEFGDDPRLLAVRLGIRVVPGGSRHCGGEIVSSDSVKVSAFGTRRERGLLLTHGIAHALLLRECWDHSHGDAWMLTGDLAVPRAGALLDASEAVRRAHAPVEFVEGWLRLSGRFGRRAAWKAESFG